MKQDTNQLVIEIKQICGQYLEEVGSGGYRVWPKSIRDRVLLLCDLVGSTKQAAELCGLSRETIYQWRAEVKKSQFKALAVVESKNKSAAVTVTKTSEPSHKVGVGYGYDTEGFYDWWS
jgi:hypothetical protein